MIVAVVVWTMSLKPYLPVTSLLKYHPTKGRSNIIIDITDSESLCIQLEQRWWTKNGASVLKSQQSWVCIQPSDHFQSCVVMFTFLSLKHMANMLWQSVPWLYTSLELCSIAIVMYTYFCQLYTYTVQYVQNIVTSSLSSYQWLEVNDVDIIDSSTSWLISSKHHRHVVVNGSKWEEWAGRGSLSSSWRGGPFTCRRWSNTVFITISI